MQNPQGHAKPRIRSFFPRERTPLSKKSVASNAKPTIGRADASAVHVGRHFSRKTNLLRLPLRPGHCEIWVCFFFLCGFFWALLRHCGKEGFRPGRPQTRRQGRQNPEGPEAREFACHPRSHRRDPRQPGAQLDSAVAKAQGGSQSGQMRRCAPPGGGIFANCARRKRHVPTPS